MKIIRIKLLIALSLLTGLLYVSCGGGGGGGGTSGGSSTPAASSPTIAIHFGGGTTSSANYRTDGFISSAVGIVSSAGYRNEIR